MNLLYVTNGAAVGIFGMVLSGAFCDIHWTKEKREFLVGSIFVLLAIQGVMYLLAGAATIRYLYPVITHVPMCIALYILTKKRLWTVISVLTAYLCCQLRRWVALFIMAVFVNSETVQNVTELIATLPLLFLLLRFVAPSVRAISNYPVSIQLQFGLIPALGYGFDYLTRVYTDLLSEGIPAAVEFMPFVCCIAYLVFVLRTSEEERKKNELEQMQSCLNLQISQAVREIEALRESQKDASTYRHDLRHHMTFIQNCLINNHTEQALDYINEINTSLDNTRITRYCNNEAINLILSSYISKANKTGITTQISVTASDFSGYKITDLCSLLANAIENAINACTSQNSTTNNPLADSEKNNSHLITIRMFEKNNKICINISNTYSDEPQFVNQIPVTSQLGHGIGIRSIISVVEKYNGIYAFFTKDGIFYFQACI